jgi:hypothetical protein
MWMNISTVEKDLEGAGRREVTEVMEMGRNHIRTLWFIRGVLLFLVLNGQLEGTRAGQGGFEEQCSGKRWMQDIFDEEPRLVDQDRSGERYEIGQNGDLLSFLHVYGSPYELGRAHGTLLRVQIHSMYLQFFRYQQLFIPYCCFNFISGI